MSKLSLLPLPALFLATTDPVQTNLPAEGSTAALWVFACCCVIAAIVGSLWAAALLLYSPTKLAKHSGVEIDAPSIKEVQHHGHEYQVLSRILSLGGILGATVLAWQAIPSGQPFRLANILVYCFSIVLLCGVLPPRIAESRAESIIHRSRGTLRVLRRVFYYPLLLPYLVIAKVMIWGLRIQESPVTEPEEIAEEILAAVSDSAQDSQLPQEERGWIENIIELKSQRAGEVMTPRTDMLAFNEETPLLDAIRKAVDSGYSRYPVYRSKLDKVVGVFYAKDALALIGSDRDSCNRTVGSLMRDALFVADSIPLADLLREFRSSKVQMAIVLDEFGGTDGLVTIEDVLEEIVGDISDEYDQDEEEQIKVIEEGRVIETSGGARIEEINACLGVEIPEREDYETVAGFVFCALDRIPKVKESLQINGLEIQILSADKRRILRMRLSRLEPATSHG